MTFLKLYGLLYKWLKFHSMTNYNSLKNFNIKKKSQISPTFDQKTIFSFSRSSREATREIYRAIVAENASALRILSKKGSPACQLLLWASQGRTFTFGGERALSICCLENGTTKVKLFLSNVLGVCLLRGAMSDDNGLPQNNAVLIRSENHFWKVWLRPRLCVFSSCVFLCIPLLSGGDFHFWSGENRWLIGLGSSWRKKKDFFPFKVDCGVCQICRLMCFIFLGTWNEPKSQENGALWALIRRLNPLHPPTEESQKWRKKHRKRILKNPNKILTTVQLGLFSSTKLFLCVNFWKKSTYLWRSCFLSLSMEIRAASKNTPVRINWETFHMWN